MTDCLGNFTASVIVGLSCRKQLVFFFVCGSLGSGAVFVIQNVCLWIKSPGSDVPITHTQNVLADYSAKGFPHARTRGSHGAGYSDENDRP